MKIGYSCPLCHSEEFIYRGGLSVFGVNMLDKVGEDVKLPVYKYSCENCGFAMDMVGYKNSEECIKEER